MLVTAGFHLTEVFEPPLTPFAAPAASLRARDANAVAHFARTDAWANRDHFADWLMPENSRERTRKVPERFVNVGVANTARVHLDENLPRPRLRLWNISNFPWTIYGGSNGSLHWQVPPRDSMAGVRWVRRGVLRMRRVAVVASACPE